MIVQPRPKAAPAKPGKCTPTKEEAAWMSAIVDHGCIACDIDGHPGTPGAVHHILRGGVRMGHIYTICLCQPGHHMDGASVGKISRHPWKAQFEAKYGHEAGLLELTQRRVKG